MVTRCNKKCPPCPEDKAVSICLRNEAEFLSSLLRLGLDEQGKHNLLEFDPSELIDWYLYAKRSFSSWPSKDPFGWGIKLLDELGKILFSLTQVTAKRPDDDPILQDRPNEFGKFVLLRPAEQNLVEDFIGSIFSTESPQLHIATATNPIYNERINRLQKVCEEASKDLKRGQNIDKWRESYEDKLECRIAFTRIEEIETFHWDERKSDVLLIIRSQFDDEREDLMRISKLKLACAYLHGVARFALSNATADGPLGYLIDHAEHPSEIKPLNSNDSATFTPTKRTPFEQEFSYVPVPRTAGVRLSCELAASFTKEYGECFGLPPQEAFFDLLFMCKEDADRGWFWVLTKLQLEKLHNIWDKDAPRLNQALERFRFSRAGIINHLDHTESLIEVVFNFEEEKYICTGIGYHLEDTRQVAKDFKDFEGRLPGVSSGAYYYFRITPHIDAENRKILPEGALVALFRIDRESETAPRIKRMALIRRLVERWRAKVDSLKKVTEVVLAVSRPFQEKTARAAIMSRNFSHNVGSHALANPRLYKSLKMEGKGYDSAKNRLGTFHSYAQGRLDFMARAMSGSGERPEPLFFVNDVLNGFFRQGVLLDTLVEDNGFPSDRLNFRVEILGNQSDLTAEDLVWDKDDYRFKLPQNNSLADVLVGIPGGSIGCHALYAFFENCLRNTVKYGKKSELEHKLNFVIRLEKCKAWRILSDVSDRNTSEDAWILRLSDDISVDEKFKITKGIREHINIPLIDEGGKFTTQGHGIQEMKVCAENLSGGEYGLRFPPDGKFNASNCDDRCTTCDEYEKYLSEAAGTAPVIIDAQPLRCYSHTSAVDQEKLLVYNLLLPCPVLLGIVNLDKDQVLGDKLQANLPDFVRHFTDIDSLAKTGAHFGVILDEEQNDEIAQTLKDLARLHPALPFRLMVVTTRKDEWQALMNKKDGGYARLRNEPFTYGKHIPGRRVQIISASDQGDKSTNLLTLLKNNDLFPDYNYLGARGWEAIALRVYDSWLREYKDLPAFDSWKICIGFEHGGKDLIAKWDKLLEPFIKTTSSNPSVSIHVVAYDKPLREGGRPDCIFSPNSEFITTKGVPNLEKLKRYQSDEQRRSPKEKRILAFDNHGEIFGEIAESKVPLSANARFHQKIGIGVSLNLFQTLASPPNTPFSFAWFIYSLAECALTKVAILDERVAQATLGEPDGAERKSGLLYPKGKERQYHKAGLFPLLTFRSYRQSTGIPFDFISGTIAEAATHTRSTLEKGTLKKWDSLWKCDECQIPEGISIGEMHCTIGIALNEEQEYKTQLLDDADILVIHEGVTDVLERKGMWNRKDVWRLYSTVPCLIRTSGRGREARHLHDCIPFIEFTELSENTYRSLNKYALCKAMLGVAGDPSDLPIQATL